MYLSINDFATDKNTVDHSECVATIDMRTCAVRRLCLFFEGEIYGMTVFWPTVCVFAECFSCCIYQHSYSAVDRRAGECAV